MRKVTLVVYNKGEVRFVINNDTTRTFTVQLVSGLTRGAVIDRLKDVSAKKFVIEKLLFDSLELSTLEGLDLDA